MKKIVALLVAVVLAAGTLVGCSASVTTTDTKKDSTATETKTEDTATTTEAPKAEATEAPAAAEPTAITLWTYPIGKWGDAATVGSLVTAFEAQNPDITVSVEYLDYTNGDDQVNTAIEGGKAPDLIMEGPERLVANWGAKGLMVDLSDLLDSAAQSEIYDSVMKACVNSEGKMYEYPLCMTAHCMAINKTVFEAAGAMQYVNAETHTWTSSEDFLKAIELVNQYTGSAVAAVYCAGQGGDQGTRAIVNNLYGGTFTNDEHTAYTADSAENIKALEALRATSGINFDASLVGGDEINLFRQGVLKVAFCWNIAQQLNSDNNDAGLTNEGDEILFMAFPTETGKQPKLCGGIWGFGIFNNGDEARIAAAKKFISFMADSAEGTPNAITSSTYFPVRNSVKGTDLSGLYADNAIMSEYSVLMPYLGDYYQVTKGWAEARTAWWNMLQMVGSGEDVQACVTEFVNTANAAASK